MEKMLAAILVNKGCYSHQAITLQLPRPAPQQMVHPRRLRMRKHRIVTPES